MATFTYNTNRSEFALMSEAEFKALRDLDVTMTPKVVFVRSDYDGRGNKLETPGDNVWRIVISLNPESGWTRKDYRDAAERLQEQGGWYAEGIKEAINAVTMEMVHIVTAYTSLRIKAHKNAIGLHVAKLPGNSPESVIGAVYGSCTNPDFAKFAVRNQWTDIIAMKVGEEIRYRRGNESVADRSYKYDVMDQIMLGSANYQVILDVNNSMTDTSNPESWVSRQIRLLTLGIEDAQVQAHDDAVARILNNAVITTAKKIVETAAKNDQPLESIPAVNGMVNGFAFGAMLDVYYVEGGKWIAATCNDGTAYSNAKIAEHLRLGRTLVARKN